MNKILTSIAQAFIESEDGREALKHYIDLKQHRGWKTHQAFLLEMGNRLSNEVLTRKFQSMEANNKLVRLEAYSMVSEVIKFLLNPVATLTNINKVKAHNIKMGATVKKRPKGE